jgi:hypothetical protein
MASPRSEWVQRVLGVTVPDDGARARSSSDKPGPRAAAPAARPLAMWLAAKDAAGAQIAALQAAMRAQPHPMFPRLADRGLNGITGRLQVGLQVALTDFEHTGVAGRDAARAKASKAVVDLRNFLATDAVVPLLDGNPLGVTVDLKGGLGAALDAIDRALTA